MVGVMVGAAVAASAFSIEEICDEFQSWGLPCSYMAYHEVYKYGPLDPMKGGMGKIRANAAYCLIRDGDQASASAYKSVAGLQSGVKSRLNITYAGKQFSQVYKVSAQRILDITVLGATLKGAEVQNLDAKFPEETEGKWSQKCETTKKQASSWGGGFTKCVPFKRVGHYLELDTESHSLDVDISKAGFDFEFKRDWAYLFAGTTKLNNPNLTDGVIPDSAGNSNSWEWGHRPGFDSEPATTFVKLGFPKVRVSGTFSFKLTIELGPLKGFYRLAESPDPENPGTYASWDPDAGMISDSQSVAGGATNTDLASGGDMKVKVKACVDVGWLGTWCANFTIINLAGKQNLGLLGMNHISYDAKGVPLKAKWRSDGIVENAEQIKTQIQSCLTGPVISHNPEEAANTDDWTNFANDVSDSFGENFHPCQVQAPDDDVGVPSFKLCDNAGNVYTPDGPTTQEIRGN